MIISKTQVQNLLKIYGKDNKPNRVGQSAAVSGAKKEDQLAISDESRIKQKAMQAVKQAPDIRADKVAEMQERISAGTYTLSEDEVAEKMIERAIVDRVI